MNCHGCDGRGWVDSKVIGPTLCPVCKGKKPEPEHVQNLSYDQDSVWIELKKGTSDVFEKILDRECHKIHRNKGKEVLAHLLFDRDIVPHGNIIFHHLQNVTITGGVVPQLSNDEIVARNYSTSEDGEIRTWGGVPISPQMWGLIKTLSEIVINGELTKFKVDANRKGNPLFCDENMLAFSFVPKRKDTVAYIMEKISSSMKEKHNTEIVNLSLHLLS